MIGLKELRQLEKLAPVPSLNVFTLTVAHNRLICSVALKRKNQLWRGLALGRTGSRVLGVLP